jgi:hypothetical protein
MAAAPAPITPFFKNDRRLALRLVKPSDRFIVFLLWCLGTVKSNIVLNSNVSLEGRTDGSLLRCFDRPIFCHIEVKKMSTVYILKFAKFKRDLQLPIAPKRGGVHPSRLAGREVYSVKAKKTGGN